MNIADELRKLQELRDTGGLTEEEFIQAKAVVLKGTSPAQGPASQESSLFPIHPTECLTPGRLRTMRIIAGTVIGGVVVFLVIVLYIVLVQNHGRGQAPARALPIVSFAAVAMLCACAPLAFLIPNVQTRLALRRILAGTWKIPQGIPPMTYATGGKKLWAVGQASMLMGLALLNGPAFLGCIAYLLDAHPLALGVVGVALVLMLYKFPTERRVRAWLERQAEVLTELHQQQNAAAER